CSLFDVLSEALEVNSSSYLCGADLELSGFPALTGYCRPYVRLKLDCSKHIELQLYSYCGDEGSSQEPADEATPLLPLLWALPATAPACTGWCPRKATIRSLWSAWPAVASKQLHHVVKMFASASWLRLGPGSRSRSQTTTFKSCTDSVRMRGRQLQFLVEWVDFPEEEDFTWDPKKHLPNNGDMIEAFKEQWLAQKKR
ncbi:MAG: hypothetical protein SGPRY_003237, partial [Prymnesium sp.]